MSRIKDWLFYVVVLNRRKRNVLAYFLHLQHFHLFILTFAEVAIAASEVSHSIIRAVHTKENKPRLT